MDSWHVTFATDGRLPMFSTDEAQLTAVRSLVRVAGPSLLLFCFVDEHLHLGLKGDRPDVGRGCRAIRSTLAHAAEVEVEAARIRPIESRSHAEWLAHRYIVAQPDKHGLPVHPALYEGSCFQDLVGARVIAKLAIRELLPRFDVLDTFAAVGLPRRPIEPVPIDGLREGGIGPIVAAAAAAVGIHGLVGQTPRVVAARRAVVSLGEGAGIARAEIAFGLGVSDRGLRQLVSQGAHPSVVNAVRIRLALQRAVAAAQGGGQRSKGPGLRRNSA